MIHLANILENINKRLIVVGVGSVFVDKERKITIDMGKIFQNLGSHYKKLIMMD